MEYNVINSQEQWANIVTQMSCSNGALEMEGVNAAVVCEVSCLWLSVLIKVSYQNKKKNMVEQVQF